MIIKLKSNLHCLRCEMRKHFTHATLIWNRVEITLCTPQLVYIRGGIREFRVWPLFYLPHCGSVCTSSWYIGSRYKATGLLFHHIERQRGLTRFCGIGDYGKEFEIIWLQKDELYSWAIIVFSFYQYPKIAFMISHSGKINYCLFKIIANHS